MAIEAKRGCGYRKVGGLYLVGGGLSAPCDRMPYPLDRCRTCGGGVKFTRGHTWLQPDFFKPHTNVNTAPLRLAPGESRPTNQELLTRAIAMSCKDDSACPVCRNREDFGPHLLLWIGRGHYSPDAFLKESRELGVSRRIAALPKGFVPGETWVLLAHLDAVPVNEDRICARCNSDRAAHAYAGQEVENVDGSKYRVCDEFQAPKPTPGIFCAFVPRAVELILKESDATPERVEKEAKRGVTVVAVPDDDRDHQGSVWDKDEDSQPELPGVSP
jgi:hypothetical protein